MGGYTEDLAYIHDAGFGDFAVRSAPSLLKLLLRHGVTEGLVVDLGCGSGLWARELHRAGYDVLGIDTSSAMLRIARSRVPQAQFRRVSLFKVKLPRCDAVTSLGESLNYLFDETNSKQALVRLFRRIHRALRPGGVFLFDLAEPGRGRRGAHAQKTYWEGPGWAVLVEVAEHPTRPQLTRRITSFRKVGKLYRHRRETHRQRLYRRSEITKELQAAGFRVHVLRGYGRRRFATDHVGFVARKSL